MPVIRSRGACFRLPHPDSDGSMCSVWMLGADCRRQRARAGGSPTRQPIGTQYSPPRLPSPSRHLTPREAEAGQSWQAGGGYDFARTAASSPELLASSPSMLAFFLRRQYIATATATTTAAAVDTTIATATVAAADTAIATATATAADTATAAATAVDTAIDTAIATIIATATAAATATIAALTTTVADSIEIVSTIAL